MSELEQPNEPSLLNNKNQTPPSGNWLEGYIAVWIGLLLVNAVFLAFALPVMAILLLLQAVLGEAGIWVGAVIIAPAWIWLCFRFFLPAMTQIIWIDGRPALFALHRVTLRRMIGVVTAQLSVLRSDLYSLSTRIGNWLNA
ncbi:hypothetical protein [Tabrizicola sp.]|uniref:hypothetical protein n=1 Tax=Tabrizicola sp. TaxID=2005166 RepID=UPI001A3B3D2A|nr:hypothetical protein [Tabrizicola sp.]MBL9073629.1 hypothetical protein [Tabrizicola sp.]